MQDYTNHGNSCRTTLTLQTVAGVKYPWRQFGGEQCPFGVQVLKLEKNNNPVNAQKQWPIYNPIVNACFIV